MGEPDLAFANGRVIHCVWQHDNHCKKVQELEQEIVDLKQQLAETNRNWLQLAKGREK